MNPRRIAILVDGGFFLKRLPKLVAPEHIETPDKIVTCLRWLCRNHVRYLTGDQANRWHQHVYRIFFYDAVPYGEVANHPLTNKQIKFAESNLSRNRNALHEALRKQRKVALRLGKVTREGDWAIEGTKSRKIIKTRSWFEGIDFSTIRDGTLTLTEAQIEEAIRLQKLWTSVEEHEIRLKLRQKGVDMRIGIDIASLTLKKQADTIVLVSGDSDFVPAAKLARREGMEFVLDPLWQAVNQDLYEHIDGMHSGLGKPKNGAAPQGGDDCGPNGAANQPNPASVATQPTVQEASDED